MRVICQPGMPLLAEVTVIATRGRLATICGRQFVNCRPLFEFCR
jgi:hypothetical protein